MKQLAEVFVQPLSPFHAQKIALIDRADFSRVRAKTKEILEREGKNPTEQFLDEGILALKMYYAVAIMDGRNQHAVSDIVDPFWHAHILHTVDYVQFCNDIFGFYVHHEPLHHSRQDEVEFVGELYDYTLGIYQKLFNSGDIDSAFWPANPPAQRLVCTHGADPKAHYISDSLFPRLEKTHRLNLFDRNRVQLQPAVA